MIHEPPHLSEHNIETLAVLVKATTAHQWLEPGDSESKRSESLAWLHLVGYSRIRPNPIRYQANKRGIARLKQVTAHLPPPPGQDAPGSH